MYSDIQLYDRENIESLAWPQTVDGSYAENFLAPLVKHGISYFIDNIQAEIFVLRVNDFIFPLVVVTENYSNSWVCSPYAHYISYGQESSDIVGNALFSKILKQLMGGFGALSRSHKMNSVVYVNNWMFSTDLYPEGLRSEHIRLIVNFLTNRFPSHAIILRSLNSITTPSLLNDLKENAFHLIASRYVFVTDAKNESVFKTRILKSDLKLWKESSYQIVDGNELQIDECSKLMDLYRDLYVVQHSHLQPQFNHEYFKLLFSKGLLNFKVLKANGEIKGVAGFYKRNQVMMCPIFGYAKNNQESNLIYRLLNTALLLEAQKENLLFNQSAGAAFFKSIRRAQGCLEYVAIYTNHLPLRRKLFWSMLKFFINRVGAKFMEKY